MSTRLARYHKVAALAEKPTPLRRLVAGLVAASVAFALVQLLLGVLWGAGSNATLFSSLAFAVAGAFAAVTLKSGMAVVYGVLGALWLLLEGLVLLLGSIAAGIG
jgi:hypothetical protein